MIEDLRAYRRKPLELPVHVGDAENRADGTIRFDTHDFSAGGAFLRSDLLFEVGEELEIEFQLPGGPAIRARGKVVHVARELGADTVAGMGIAFSNLSERDRDAVSAFLANG